MGNNTPAETENYFEIGDKEFWQKYFQGRPQVPTSFWERLYTYHTSHIKTPPVEPFGTINDIGAGAGVFSRIFAQRFSKVIVTEPSQETLTSAKHFLTESQDPDSNANKFTFLNTRAEDRKSQTPNSIDMVFMGTSIHFTNPPDAMVAIAEQLKPSGTFVFCLFGYCSFFNAATQRVWNRLYDLVYESGRDQLVANDANVDMIRQCVSRFESGYDNIAVPQELFRDVRRVKLNKLYPEAFVWGQGATGKLAREDRTDPVNEELVEERDEDWFIEVDVEWMKLHIATFPFAIVNQVVLEGFWDELGKTADEDGKFRGYWPVSIIMATKR